MKPIHYKNGNYHVVILPDGTKIRHTDGDEFNPVFPESIDVKVTDYCDMGCAYCHEKSTVSGTHADVKVLTGQLNCLPAGVELAVGGGNPLDWPDLEYFLCWAKGKGFIVNLTVNQGHLLKHKEVIIHLVKQELVKGIGVSITQNSLYNTKWLTDITPHVVFHVIAGVNPITVLDHVHAYTDKPKVLILGYKTFGRGVRYKSPAVEESLAEWKKIVPERLYKQHLSFDNLALEQLDVQSALSPETWERFYMGDDFTHTMYIDAVNEQFAPTSRSPKRMGFTDIDLLDFFDQYRGKLDVE